MRALLAIAALGLAASACNGGQYEIAGYSLTVQDSGYSSADYFCNALGMGQIDVRMVGYKPACSNPPNPNNDHTELQLVLAVGAHPNNSLPYSVSKVDCTLGPGDNAVAYFKHFPPAASQPDAMTEADSGSIQVSQYDPTGTKPAMGQFNLTFGGKKISGSFKAAHCP